MALKNHLIIFTRTPRLGAAKRRLAADIGTAAAMQFARANLDHLARKLGPDTRWSCSLAVSPDRDASGRLRLAGGLGTPPPRPR